MNEKTAELIHSLVRRSNGMRNRGDITSWASATSKPFGSALKPIRPEVKFEKRSNFSPIRRLGSVHSLSPRPTRHDPNSVVVNPNAGNDGEVRKAVKACEETIRLEQASYDAMIAVNNALLSLAKGGGVVKQYA